MTELKKGDLVETFKGAKFQGRILEFHALDSDNPGAVVEAEHPLFAGTRHVYPLKQLRAAAPQAQSEPVAALATPPAQGDMVLVPREPTDAMIEAGIEALREHTQLVAIDRDPLFVWRYMLHAATPSEER